MASITAGGPSLIEVKLGDILGAEADMLALKFADGFHGADRFVSGKTNVPSGFS
jgi:hypothetical protein